MAGSVDATARAKGMTVVTRDRFILDYAELGHVEALKCWSGLLKKALSPIMWPGSPTLHLLARSTPKGYRIHGVDTHRICFNPCRNMRQRAMAVRQRLTVNLDASKFPEFQRLAKRHDISMAWLGSRAISSCLGQHGGQRELPPALPADNRSAG